MHRHVASNLGHRSRNMSETTKAFGTAGRRLWYELRCYWCEMFATWAFKIAPKGYTPSFVKVGIEAYWRGRNDAIENK